MKNIKTIKATRLSTMVILLSLFTPLAALAGKIPDGRYTPGAVGVAIEVRGNKYTIHDDGGTPYPWKSTSGLVLIKKGVIQERSNRGQYYCSSYPKNGNYVCTRNGWKKGSA
jgi:hypothetical protein